MKKLYICGYGLTEDDISLKTLRILEKSDIIISPSLDKHNFISRYLLKLSKKTIVNVRNLPPEKIISKILNTLNKFDIVSLLVYGNPLFMNIITEMLIKRIKNTEIVTIPAISSFDLMFHVIPMLNISSEKIVLLNNRIIEKDSRDRKILDMDISSHIFLFGAEAMRSRAKKVFFESFIKYYGREHPLYIIHTEDITVQERIIKKIKIEDISKHLHKNIMQTLYIPPKKSLTTALT
ncbi:MAG: SAM-dependent methyltransferase [Elusimicrobiales bacterium]